MKTRSLVAAANIGFVFLIAPAAAEPLPRVKPESMGVSSERLQRIGEVLRADIEGGWLPGAVVAIARKGKLVYYEAFGYADKEAGIAMPKDAIFRINGMTRPITAIGGLILHEEKRLLFDQPIGKYLPQLVDRPVAVMRVDATGEPAIETVAAKRPVSIEDMLRHTDGMGHGVGGNTKLHKLYPHSTIRAANSLTGPEFLAKLGALPLQSQPGTAFQIGFGSDVLGRAIEAVAGQSLGDYLKQRLFTPLGMVDTAFVMEREKAQRFAKPLPKNPETGKPQRQSVRTTPYKFECAVCLNSTAADYLRFAQMLLDRGKLGNTRIVSAKSVEYMTSDRVSADVAVIERANAADYGGAVNAAEYGYGLAVKVRRRDGASPSLASSGEYGAQSALGPYFWVDPKRELVAVFMAFTPGLIRLHYRQAISELVLNAIED